MEISFSVTFLLLNVFFDYCLVESDCAHVVSLSPEMSIAELVLEVCVFIEKHQRTLSLLVPHELGHTQLWGYAYQHVHMIRHQMSFYYLHSLVCAQLLDYVSHTFFVLIVNYFLPILWSEHYVVLTNPFSV